MFVVERLIPDPVGNVLKAGLFDSNWLVLKELANQLCVLRNLVR